MVPLQKSVGWLLPQPYAFKGRPYVPMDSHLHKPMVASEVRDQRIRQVELDAAGTSSRVDGAAVKTGVP